MNEYEVLNQRLFLSQASQEDLYKYLINKYEWAEKYIFYYVYYIYAVRQSIMPILERVTDEDKNHFSPEIAYNYLREYEKTRLSFAVVIPTCNRHKAIEYLLCQCASLYRRYGIDIIIYDSSNDDRTENVVASMRDKGYYNVIYKRYLGYYDGFSLDHKIINAYSEFGQSYEYMWLCRDGLIPIIDEFIDEMRVYSEQGIDCLIVDTMARNDFVEKRKVYSTLDDCESLLLDQADRLQTLGMLIISNRLFDKLIKYEPLSEKNYSLWQMAAPFHLFAKEPYTIIFLVKNVFAFNAQAAQKHFWSKASNTLEQWAKNWVNVITNMPKEYDNVKEKCLMVYTVDFHPFSLGTVVQMRGWGGMKYSLVKQYRGYIKKVTKTPVLFFYIVSIMPKFLVRLLYKMGRLSPSTSIKIINTLKSVMGIEVDS